MTGFPATGFPAATDARAWRVGVVIPARDEADTIATTVRSVLHSLTTSGVGAASSWIVVVADGCRDETAARARAALGRRGEVATVDVGSVGTARRIGTDRVLARLVRPGRPLDRCWLLTTDADTVVACSWVDAQLRLGDAGAAAVAGIVEVDSFAGHPPEVADRHRLAYRLHPDGSHPHVHGANLGVRADAYRAVGGWGHLATAEDHDLWGRLRRAGWPTVSSTAAVVTTSGRPDGRAPDGFAGHLRALADGALVLAPDAALAPTWPAGRPSRVASAADDRAAAGAAVEVAS